MATRNSNTAQKSSGRRPGRPSNASKVAAVQSKQSQLIDVAIAAASAAVKAVYGIVDGGVQSIATPQGSQSQSASTSGSTSQSVKTGGSQSQGNQSATTAHPPAKKAPGRKTDGTSNMSLTRAFYAENLKADKPLNRAAFVTAASERFKYKKAIANTYVSNIEKEGGYKLERRGGNAASRTPSKRRTAQTQQTAIAA